MGYRMSVETKDWKLGGGRGTLLFYDIPTKPNHLVTFSFQKQSGYNLRSFTRYYPATPVENEGWLGLVTAYLDVFFFFFFQLCTGHSSMIYVEITGSQVFCGPRSQVPCTTCTTCTCRYK